MYAFTEYAPMFFLKAITVVVGTVCLTAEATAVVAQAAVGGEVVPEILNLTGASLHVGVTIWMINRIDRLIKDVVDRFNQREEKEDKEAADREDRREKERAELVREMVSALRESSRALAVFSARFPVAEQGSKT